MKAVDAAVGWGHGGRIGHRLPILDGIGSDSGTGTGIRATLVFSHDLFATRKSKTTQVGLLIPSRVTIPRSRAER